MVPRRVASLLTGLLVAGAAFSAPLVGDPFTPQQRGYWAFQEIERPEVPTAKSRGWVRNAVDEFVARKLEAKKIAPGERADKVTLIRRAYFDLVGIPPTPEQVAAFDEDNDPDAFSRVVDDLLASPQYGERWGRHWLDLARYAESEGFKADETRPNAWRYRDYVIQAFNDDKPYDRFIKEQIAGDELWPDDLDARVATAFNRNFPDESNAANLRQRRQEILHDITDTVGATFLGLTYGCAKCHDHKFDPIPQKDYYRLQAYFANTAEDDDIVLLNGEELKEYERQLAAWEDATRGIRAQIDELFGPSKEESWAHQVGRRTPETRGMLARPVDQQDAYERQIYRKHRWEMNFINTESRMAKELKGENKEEYEKLRAELDQFDHLRPAEPPKATGVRDIGREAPPTYVLGISNYDAPGEEVAPGALSILDPAPAAIPALPELESTGRRTALANWLADKNNPLTPRVMVNRIWHYHFGQGIVRTPSDFGLMGESPTHPELLDWLSDEFIRSGWSIKHMHRLIMNSASYQQNSSYRAGADKADSLNRLFWRFPPQRLEAEVIRDASLAVAGMLDPAMGGPSVYPPLPDGMPTPRGGWKTSENAEDSGRRSVYVFVRRNARYPMLQAFDMPDTHESCSRRTVTTTAPQALSMLNNNQAIRWAQGFAGHVFERNGGDLNAGVDDAYELAFSRPPDGWEKDKALTFLDEQARLIAERHEEGGVIALPTFVPESVSAVDAAALVDFCHTLLNANEFVFRY
ncbi:MAG: DUF1549 and DUF1553 domain-containing protein [Acidobacteria bacterium]|nr:DUF1549 and DUF1553 domain-containing protein [Acidobacteriota bacterium]